MDIYATTEYSTKSTEVAQMSFIQLVIFVAGCYGMYFGKGLLDLFHDVVWLAKLVRNQPIRKPPLADLPGLFLTYTYRHIELDGRVGRLENKLPCKERYAVGEHLQFIGQHELRHRQPVDECRITIEYSPESNEVLI